MQTVRDTAWTGKYVKEVVVACSYCSLKLACLGGQSEGRGGFLA
jgi:hypothetical protein